MAGNEAKQDLITARRIAAPEGPYWGPLTPSDYIAVAAAPDREAALLSLAVARGWTDDAVGAPVHVLAHEQSLATLRRTLGGGPKTFDTVAKTVFGDDPAARQGLSALVDVASAMRDGEGTTALSARYHLFLRATEGAFTCLSPSGPHVQLARHVECPECDSPVFEIGSCKRCGAVHVVGSPAISAGVVRLEPRNAGTRGTWLVLGDQPELIDEDEEAVTDDGPFVAGEHAALCTQCGAINDPRATKCGAGDCGSSGLRPVRKLKQRGDEIAGCVVCGARGAGTVRVFETGPDASGAVITTSLYQGLPPSSEVADSELPGEGRKLLAFSDSRQAAAYFAPYLQDSYGRLQRRRLISQGLIAAGAGDEPVGVEDLTFETRKAAKKVKVFSGRMTAQQEMRQVAPWIMAEVVATDDRQSLEGLGLVSVAMYQDPSWPAPKPLLTSD